MNAAATAAREWADRYYSGHSHHAVAAKVVLIVVEQLDVKFDDFTPTSRFIEDLRVYDLDSVELVRAVEEEFHFEVSDEAAEKIQLVSDLISLVGEMIEKGVAQIETEASATNARERGVRYRWALPSHWLLFILIPLAVVFVLLGASASAAGICLGLFVILVPIGERSFRLWKRLWKVDED